MNDAHPDHEKRGSDGETRRRSLRESILSPTVRKLLQIPGITPLSFVRSAAYALSYHFLSRVDLPEGAVNLAANIPDHDVHLLASAATLVVAPKLQPALAGLLIQIAADVHRSESMIDSHGHEFPLVDYLDFPLHVSGGV